MTRTLLAAFVVLILGGCSTEPIIQTERYPSDLKEPSRREITASYWLPQARFPLTIKRKNCEISIDLGKPEFFPDPTGGHYELRYMPDDFSNDTVSIATDESGLLSAINAESEPQAKEIFGKAFEIAGAMKNFSEQISIAELKEEVPACNSKADIDVTYALNPTAPASVQSLRDHLPKDIIVLSLTAERQGSSPATDREARKCLPDGSEERSGVCYRPAWPYDVTLALGEFVLDKKKGAKKSDGHPVVKATTFALLAPDPEQTLYVPLNRRGPAKANIKLSFSHGMLTKYENVHTSALLAAISLPADILKSILGFSTSGSGSAAAAAKKSD